MLVVFGANGMTGREVIREAKLRNIPVRPVVRNDHDTQNLEDFIDVNELCFADADHPASLSIAFQDASAVICCLDARTAGWGATRYTPMAAANVVQAAHSAGIDRILQLSVMGAYRWSPNPLNRQSFHLDLPVRRLQVPWTMLRVSCYHDELIDAHIRPPDEGLPHPFLPSARYAPVSRRDTARVILNIMPRLIPNRTLLLGGPEVFTGAQLEELASQYRIKSPKNNLWARYRERRSRTNRGPLPDGDMTVPPETTEIMVGWVPTESLPWMLDPLNYPLPEKHEPFWNRSIPAYHPADQQKYATVLSTMNRGLRFALHNLLIDDLKRLNQPTDNVFLDFSSAKSQLEGHSARPHKSILYELEDVALLDKNEQQILRGNVCFIYDDLADELLIWWEREEAIPEEIWNLLDLGVRRRLSKHSKYGKDKKVLEFAAAQHQRDSLKK